MKVPKAPSMCTKMAAFYQCIKPEPSELDMISTRVMDIKLREAAEGLGEDSTGKKKSKFKTFKKFFGKKKRKESSSSTGSSTWKQSQAKNEVMAIESGPVGYDSEDELEDSRGALGSRALSHDSIFIPESGQDPPRPVRVFSQENVCDRIKALQLKIQCNVKMGPPPPPGSLPTKRGDDAGMSSEDDGLPRSPPEMSLLHDIASETSTSPRTSDSSMVPVADFDYPPEFSSCLDNSAAKHKLLVKPRNQRSSKMRRLSSRAQSESLSDLTCTPEEEEVDEKPPLQVSTEEQPSSGQQEAGQDRGSEPEGPAPVLPPAGPRVRRARLQHCPALTASMEEESPPGENPSSRPATPEGTLEATLEVMEVTEPLSGRTPHSESPSRPEGCAHPNPDSENQREDLSSESACPPGEDTADEAVSASGDNVEGRLSPCVPEGDTTPPEPGPAATPGTPPGPDETDKAGQKEPLPTLDLPTPEGAGQERTRRGLRGAAPPPEAPGPPVSRGRPRPGPRSSSAPSRPCPGSPCYRPSLSRSCPRPLTPALGTLRRWGCPWTPGRRAGLRGGHRTGQLVRDQVERPGEGVCRGQGEIRSAGPDDPGVIVQPLLDHGHSLPPTSPPPAPLTLTPHAISSRVYPGFKPIMDKKKARKIPSVGPPCPSAPLPALLSFVPFPCLLQRHGQRRMENGGCKEVARFWRHFSLSCGRPKHFTVTGKRSASRESLRGQRGQGASRGDGAGSRGPRAGPCVCNPGGRRSSRGGGSVSHPFLLTGGGRKGLHVELEAEAKPDRKVAGPGTNSQPALPWVTVGRQKRRGPLEQPPSQEDKPAARTLKSDTGRPAKVPEKTQEPVKQADFVRSKSFLLAPAKPPADQRQGAKLRLQEGLQRGISLSHQNLAAQSAVMMEKELHQLKRASYSSTDQPSWMELARKKSQAWSDMPQIIK
ncbi:hypothetical protein E5288_WYG017293 [Bos mutus]|uniref:DUF4592 domain-containing protein n=1 Tax=Bos mutus TaxID=72004 RepID=A0A6B0RIZ3_9CETA|nr:hypothetical protein [Bos mutus]